MPEEESGFDAVRQLGAMHIIYITGSRGIARFTELKEYLDVSGPTIATRLDDLEKAGLLERTYHDEMPPRVEYSLTPAGEELYDRLIPIFEWAVEQYGMEAVEYVDHTHIAECEN